MGLHELVDDGSGRRIGQKIVVLRGVLEQVEELARLHGVLVDDQLVTLGLESCEAPVLADREGAGRKGGGVVDIGMYFSFFTFDAMGDLA